MKTNKQTNKQSNFLIGFASLGLGLFLQTAAVGQNWSIGPSRFFPTNTGLDYNSNVRVGIGVTSPTEFAERLNVKGSIQLLGGSTINSNTGFGLTIKNGNANTTTGIPLQLIGATNCNTCIPGSVKIESGDQFAGSSTYSSAPLEVGWNTIRIGTGSSLATLRTGGYLLGISGKMISEEVVVKLVANWPDFVFAKNYQLKPLSELETYIKANQHLPGIPSECDIKEKDGIAVSDMLTRQMQKIEELTLYLIEQDKALQALRTELATFKATGGVK